MEKKGGGMGGEGRGGSLAAGDTDEVDGGGGRVARAVLAVTAPQQWIQLLQALIVNPSVFVAEAAALAFATSSLHFMQLDHVNFFYK
jgi:hypothetical protein